MIFAASIKEPVSQDLKIVECLAILYDLQLCSHLEISCLTIEYDCQLVVNRLQKPNCSFSPLGNIMLDIRSLMNHFHKCNIQFDYRNCIQAAHRLPRFAWKIEHILLEYENLPEFLSQIMWFDKLSVFLANLLYLNERTDLS